MGSRSFLWQLTMSTVTGGLIGLTISDRYLSITPVRGISMHPTFANSHINFPGSLRGDIVLVERFCLDKYKFSHGDVVVFKSPNDHKKMYVKRVIGLPGDWIQVPKSSQVVRIPEGHCWVEGDNSDCSLDSRSFGSVTCDETVFLNIDGYYEGWKPGLVEVLGSSDEVLIGWGSSDMIPTTIVAAKIPLGLVGGRATHIIWPPQRIGKEESKIPPGRVSSL